MYSYIATNHHDTKNAFENAEGWFYEWILKYDCNHHVNAPSEIKHHEFENISISNADFAPYS